MFLYIKEIVSLEKIGEQVNNKKIKKITLIGTTGSGKTTFLKNLVGEFKGAEVNRQVSFEDKVALSTFDVVDRNQFENSTTTVSMNVKNVMFLVNRVNQFLYFPLINNTIDYDIEEIDCVYPCTIFDTAGQERFEFMREIGIDGTDGVIIFADGTNIASIERVRTFIDLTRIEEKASGKSIPITVFVNKKDLEHKGIYIGKSTLERWLDESISIEETTNTDMNSFLYALRNFLSSLDDFPIDVNRVKAKVTV